MNKSEKIELLKNKKQTISLLINANITTAITFLAIATPIVASTILAFNNTWVTYFMMAFYLIVIILFLRKPLSNIFSEGNKLRKIDDLIYNLILDKNIENAIIENLYKEN